ncbi:MAG: PKD-like domain-containing protein [Bacteroidota bacterium]
MQKLISIFAGVLFFSTYLNAQENCGTAVPVTDLTGVVCATSTPGTVNDLAAGSCDDGAIDTWFSFVAQAGTATINVSSDIAGWRPEFLVVESDNNLCSGNFFEYDCFDLNGNYQTIGGTVTGLTIGQTYWIVVSSNGNLTTGTLSVCVDNQIIISGCTDNDACADALAVTLNASAAGAVCLTDCNTGSDPGIDFVGSPCEDMGGATVWYTFTTDAGAATMDIDITGLTNPEFTLWANTCSPWTNIAGSCTEGAGGVASATVNVSPNTTYILSVSDVNGVEGTFDLCIDQNLDASLCNVNDLMTETASSDPTTPVGGPYSPGESVSFCYTILQYRKENCNWLMGIVPTFGNCWSSTSFNGVGMPLISTPPAIAGNETGSWQWYAAGQVTYNNIVGSLPANSPMPGGWYFQCNSCGLSNADPDLSWGDGGAAGAPANDCDINGNGYTWTTCFTLIAGTSTNCTNGTTDCTIQMKTYADGEIGGYNNTGCTGDTPLITASSFLCCVQPVITPVANQSFCSGGTATAALTSDQDPAVTYTWTVVAGSNITGASAGSGTSISQVLTNSGSTAQTVVYTISGSNGSCAGTTTFTVTVNPTPTVNDPADQTLCANAATTAVTFTGNSGAATYNWTNSNTSIGLAASGSGNIASFTALNAGITAQTATITVTPTLGSCPGSAQTFTITVNPVPTVNDPADQALCANLGTTLVTFSGNSGATTYNWTNSNTSIGLAASGSGNIASFTALNPGITAQTATITVTPTLGTCPGTAQTFTITVNPVPTVNDPADQILCANLSTTAVTFSGNSGATTYNWTNSNTSIGLAASGSGNIASFTAINAGTTAQVATVIVTPTLGSCPGTAQTFTITVNPVPTVNDPTDQILCANLGTTAVTFSGNSGSTTYNWTNSNTSIGLAASGSGNIASFTAINAGATAQVATVIVTPTLGSCSGTAQTFTITVNPVPTVNDPADQILCANLGTTAVTFSGNSGSTTYNWTNSNTSIGLAASGSGNIASFTAINAGATAQVATVIVTPTLGSCSGTAQTFTITVNPVPTVNDPADQILCANLSTTAVTFSGNSGSTTYNWTNSNTTIGLAASGSGNIASFTALNAGATTQTATIVVTPLLGTCSGSTQTFTITVNPVPTVNDPADQMLCANVNTTAVTFTGNSGSTTYNWTNSNTSIGLAASGSGNIASFTAINAGITVQTGTIVVTPVLGTCSGTSQTFTITVNPIPSFTTSFTNPLSCGASDGTITLSGLIPSTSYNLSYSDDGVPFGPSSITTTAGGTFVITGLNAGGYSSIIVNNGSCNSLPASVSLSDPLAPVFSIATISNPSTCLGTDGGIHIEGTGTLSPSSNYDLTYVDNGVGVGPIAITTDANGDFDITGLNAGSYTSFVISVAGCSGSQPGPIVLSDPIAPVAVASTSTPSICEGSDIILTGNNVLGATYNWTGPNTFNSLLEDPTIVGAVVAATGTYSYTITLNNCTSTPSTVNVTVTALPVISGTLVACVGTTSQLSATTAPAGTPWTSSNPAIASVDVNGLVTALTAGSTTITYTNSGGCQDAELFTVNTTPTVNDAFDQILCGSTMTTAVAFTGNNGATVYNWTNNDATIGLAASGSGNIAAFSAINTGITAVVATITVTPTLGTCIGSSQSFTITVDPVPTVNDPSDQSLCAGASVTAVSFTGNSGATSYGWTNDNATIGLASGGSGNIASFSAINAGATVQTANIVVTPTIGACLGATQTFSIIVNPVPTVNDPSDQSLCGNTATSAVTFTGSNVTSTYNWTNSNTSIGLAAAGSGDIASFSALNAGASVQTATIIVTPVLGTCTGLSQTFTITVNPVPTVNDPADQPLCAGSATTAVSFSGNSGSTVYDWTNDNNTIGLSSVGSGNIGSFTTINTGATSQVATITVIPTLGSCSGTSQQFVITVNPVPTVNDPSDQTLCGNLATTAINFTGNSGLTSYNWTNSTTSIGLAASGSGNIVSFTATNAGALAQTATITVTPVLGTCTGSAQTFTITVDAVPTVNDPADQVVCAGDPTTTVVFAGNSAMTTYNWLNDNTSIGLSANGSVDISSFTATNTGGTSQLATITVTPELGACMGTAQMFTITVDPTPTFTVTGIDPTVCNASDGSITISGLNPSVSYNLTYNDDGSAVSLTVSSNASGDIILSGQNAGNYNSFTLELVSSGCIGTSASTVNLINPLAPSINPLADQVVCDTYSLPTITGTDLTGTESYWTGANGTGTQMSAGAAITNSQTIYIYDASGACFDEESFDVTVNLTPAITNPGNQLICESYALPVINGTNISATAAYFNNSQLNSGTAITGPLTSSQTVYIFDSNGTCSDEISFDVTINPLPTVNSISGGSTYCMGEFMADIAVDVTGNPNFTIAYTLNGNPQSVSGSASPISLGNVAGVYVLTGIQDVNCSNTATGTQTIIVNPIPAAPLAGADSIYCSAWDLVPMSAQGAGGGTYTWYDVNGTVVGTGANLTPTNTLGVTEYYVSETISGCEGPSSIVTITINQCEITVPTAFTPDGDGVNDNWEIIDLDAVYPNNVVSVFNRWGNIVYQHDSSVDGPYDASRWDGTFKGELLPVASYYFVIDLNDEEKNSKTGTISILK